MLGVTLQKWEKRMAMYKVSESYLDERNVRGVAAIVVLLVSVALVFRWEWLGAFVAVDFFLRAFTRLPSALAIAAKTILGFFESSPKPIFASPKRFAAGIGFVFSAATALFLHFGLFAEATIVGGILVFCALLESVFKICLGCYSYNFVLLPLLSVFKNEKP